MGGEHGGLPNLAFLAFAVPQQHEHRGGDVIHLEPQPHAAGHREPLAEGAGGHLYAGHQMHVRMALKAAAQLAQGAQLLRRKVPGSG